MSDLKATGYLSDYSTDEFVSQDLSKLDLIQLKFPLTRSDTHPCVLSVPPRRGIVDPLIHSTSWTDSFV